MELDLGLTGVERQDDILRRLRGQLRISVPEICAAFAVSEATARRDLEALASRGLIQRVHGGALAIRRASPESPMLVRSQEQAREKQWIGRATAALVQDGETVFLGSGTTVLEAARALRDRQSLTVITNSLPVLNLLVDQPGITLIGLGGSLRDSEFSLIGHITEQALAEVRADRVIMGIRALNVEHGRRRSRIAPSCALADRSSSWLTTPSAVPCRPPLSRRSRRCKSWSQTSGPHPSSGRL